MIINSFKSKYSKTHDIKSKESKLTHFVFEEYLILYKLRKGEICVPNFIPMNGASLGSFLVKN